MQRASLRRVQLLVAAFLAVTAPAAIAQDVVGHSASLSAERGSLELKLSDGTMLSVVLSGGQVRINGTDAATYQPGGAFENGWRDLVARAGRLGAADLVRAVRGWTVEALADTDLAAKDAVTSAFETLAEPAPLAVPSPPPPPGPPPVPPVLAGIDLNDLDDAASLLSLVKTLAGDPARRADALRDGTVHVGDFELPSAQRHEGSLLVLDGDAEIRGHVTGSVVTVDGDLLATRGARIDGNAIAIDGEVERQGAVVGGVVRSGNPDFEFEFGRDTEPDVEVSAIEPSAISTIAESAAGLLGSFVALACIGFGLVFFLPRELEIVSDTVTQAFARSFFAGLLAQPLVLPALLILVAALVLTVVGIVAVPLVVAAFVVVLFVAVLGGYLAAARSIGEFVVGRRLTRQGLIGTPTPYRYLLVGVGSLLAIWVPSAFFGWVPVAGPMLLGTAAVFTWIVGTAGFGAVLLSRAGLRGAFVRRHRPELAPQFPQAAAPAVERAGEHNLTG